MYSEGVLVADRQRQILQVLQRQGSSSTIALAQHLGVSEATVRRDLVGLGKKGMLQRVHGGALLVTESEAPFEQVIADHATDDERSRIARAAAAMIQDGSSVLLDIGTTTLAVAQHLHGRDVTVLTTSLAVVNELADDDVSMIVLGGTYRRNYRSLVGLLAEESIKQFRVDLALLGTSGILPNGAVSDTTMVEVPIKRAMMSVADRTVLLASSNKFPGSGLATICQLSELDALVCTTESEPRAREAIGEGRTELILV